MPRTKRAMPSIVARRFAELHGSQFYIGRPCVLGHILRYTSSGNCVTCSKAKSSKRYYAIKAMFS